MKIGIISDTHDHIPNFKKAINFFNKEKIKLMIHCGDWVSPFMLNLCADLKCDVITVFGNNDGDKFRLLSMGPKLRVEFRDKLAEVKLDKRKIAIFHGDPEHITKMLVESKKFDVVFSGHTHKPLNDLHGKTLHINPGSCAFYWDRSGKQSVAIYDTKTNTAKIHVL